MKTLIFAATGLLLAFVGTLHASEPEGFRVFGGN